MSDSDGDSGTSEWPEGWRSSTASESSESSGSRLLTAAYDRDGSAIERRLAPVIAFLVIVSLILTGGYLLFTAFGGASAPATDAAGTGPSDVQVAGSDAPPPANGNERETTAGGTTVTATPTSTPTPTVTAATTPGKHSGTDHTE